MKTSRFDRSNKVGLAVPLKGVEEPAANLFEQWLIKSGYQSELEEGDDPPDVVLEVERLGRWAVEVTVLQQYFAQNGEPRERTTIEQSLLRICDNVRAKIGNELQRTYWLNISGPVTRQSLRKIERRAINYVRSGKTEEEVLDDYGRVRIKTFLSPPRFVDTVGLDQSVRSGDEKLLIANIHANHKCSLKRILKNKLLRLTNPTIYQRRILLIWNSYYFGDPATVRDALADIQLPTK